MDGFDASSLLETPLDGRIKGFPYEASLRLGEVGRQGWNISRGDLPSPVAVLKQAAVDWNLRWMGDYLRDKGVRFAPHVKTTMAPQLMQRQLDAGAWALTVATTRQLQTCLHFGATRLLLANQPMAADAAFIAKALRERPQLELYCLVDSEAGLAVLERALENGVNAGARLRVLVELGFTGGRTGCRSIQEALDLMRRVRATSVLELGGVETYEGLHQTRPVEQATEAVGELLGNSCNLFRVASSNGLLADDAILTAGGSAFYPDVVESLSPFRSRVVVRSGCYLVHDHGLYEGWRARSDARSLPGGGPRPALEILARVQSRPEPGLIILMAGKRDLGSDAGLAQPIRRLSGTENLQDLDTWETLSLSDHHTHVRIPEFAEVEIGDWIALGVSHPCTTLDKWPLIYVVDDAYNIGGAVRTFF